MTGTACASLSSRSPKYSQSIHSSLDDWIWSRDGSSCIAAADLLQVAWQVYRSHIGTDEEKSTAGNFQRLPARSNVTSSNGLEMSWANHYACGSPSPPVQAADMRKTVSDGGHACIEKQHGAKIWKQTCFQYLPTSSNYFQLLASSTNPHIQQFKFQHHRTIRPACNV